MNRRVRRGYGGPACKYLVTIRGAPWLLILAEFSRIKGALKLLNLARIYFNAVIARAVVSARTRFEKLGAGPLHVFPKSAVRASACEYSISVSFHSSKLTINSALKTLVLTQSSSGHICKQSETAFHVRAFLIWSRHWFHVNLVPRVGNRVYQNGALAAPF